MSLLSIGYILGDIKLARRFVMEALDHLAAGRLTDWEVLFTLRMSANYERLTPLQASSLWAICVERRPRFFSEGISVAKTIATLLRMSQYLNDMDRDWLESLQVNGIECLDIDGIERLSGIAWFCDIDSPRARRPCVIRTAEDEEFVLAIANDIRRSGKQQRRRRQPCSPEPRGQRPSGGDLSGLFAALDGLGAAVKADCEAREPRTASDEGNAREGGETGSAAAATGSDDPVVVRDRRRRERA